MLIAVTDLPEPDSPTIAEHLAAATSKLIPSTALTTPASVLERRVQVAHGQQHLAVGRGWCPLAVRGGGRRDLTA